MSMAPRGLYTIPFSQNFLMKLAEGLLDFSKSDETLLTRTRVLLPTRRAARGLRDAFLDINKGKPILLPRFQPIGDIDADELDLTLSGLGLDIANIPPAIEKLQRQFLLEELIRKKEGDIPYEQSLALAKELATLIDQVHTEGLDFSSLPDLAPKEDWAKHWQDTLSFLEIVTIHWPKILKQRGQIDPARRRALLMEALTKLWRDHPPQIPVIAAGSTGSIPATANLLKTILSLPNGSVILPGLDKDMDEESWASIDETHPQATMKNFLKFTEKERQDVEIWPPCQPENTQRNKLARAMMLPASSFGSHKLTGAEINDLKEHISICEAETAREQALVIATALRMTLEDKNKTACFVTPDRDLARRVTTVLKRWNIEADDSAGQALSSTPSGILVVSTINMLSEKFSPIPLLECLKHPISKFRKHDLSKFEKSVLRGPKPAEGWEGILERTNRLSPETRGEILPLIHSLGEIFSPLRAIRESVSSPCVFLKELINFLEEFSGERSLFWGQPESESLSIFFSRLLAESESLPDMSFETWSGIIKTLLSQETYRETQSRHPRIVILGQLESRLIRHDVMILGGLNEGMWPAEPDHDPWMSRPMRQKFGLPPAARSIGLSAHDFISAIHAPKVIITRAIKEGGTETVPSRWLQRLSTLLNAAGEKPNWTKSDLLEWSRRLDKPESYETPEAPSPKPERIHRPQSLSATWVEKWINNPYHVYANKILGLKRVDSLEEDSIHADRGTLVHEIMEEFIHKTEDRLPQNSRSLFIGIAKEKLSNLESISPHWHYWWPKIEKMADWVEKTEAAWRKDARPWRQEKSGYYKIYNDPVSGRSFTVTATADRIDLLKTGGAAIIDYKTGSTPSLKNIRKGRSPQLPIEALILEEGGFENTKLSCNALTYWKIGNKSEAIHLHKKEKSISYAALVPNAREGLLNLITQFEDPTTPYVAIPPKGPKIYEDERAYAHLARTAEWAIIEDGEEDEEEEDDTEGDAA